MIRSSIEFRGSSRLESHRQPTVSDAYGVRMRGVGDITYREDRRLRRAEIGELEPIPQLDIYPTGHRDIETATLRPGRPCS